MANDKELQPALLDCENSPACGKWVLHRFERIDRLPDGSGAVIYRCTKCGHPRRWGLLARASVGSEAA